VTTPPVPPKRVRVTSSRRSARPVTVTPLARDLDEQTGLGDVYLAGLMRAQLRLSLVVVGLAALGIGGLPLLLLAIPSTRSVVLLGLPFPWLVLGVLVYPTTWLLARWYAAAAERVERQFRDVVGTS
jgi:hypothetical protein